MRRPQKRSDRRLEEVAKAVGGGYCRLRISLSLALGVRKTVRLGALEGGGGLKWTDPNKVMVTDTLLAWWQRPGAVDAHATHLQAIAKPQRAEGIVPPPPGLIGE